MPLKMLLKSINVKWYEWVFIGSVLILGLTVYLQSNKLETTSQQLTALQQGIDDYERSNEYLVYLREFEDLMAFNAMAAIDALVKNQQSADEKFLYDYLRLVNAQSPQPERDVPVSEHGSPMAPEPVSPPASEIADEHVVQPTPSLTPPTQSPARSTDDRLRVSLIVERLQHAYQCSQSPIHGCSSDVPSAVM